MLARWMTLLVWLLAAGSALFWGLRLFVASPPLPQRTPVASAAPVVRGDLTRLLGVDPPPPVAQAAAEPAPDARFQLVGVVAPRSAAAAGEGLALIAVDGKPAKAYRVGALVDGQNVLKSVAARGATLGPLDGAALVALNIAAPPVAATGILPSTVPGNFQAQPIPQPVPRSSVPPPPTPVQGGEPSPVKRMPLGTLGSRYGAPVAQPQTQ